MSAGPRPGRLGMAAAVATLTLALGTGIASCGSAADSMGSAASGPATGTLYPHI